MTKMEKLEKQLAKVCEDIYLLNLKGKRITPLPPKIIIRVLPKEHKTEGGLFLPGNVQNKPVYEGIVLETWKPWTEYKHKTVSQTDATKLGFNVSRATETIAINHVCDFNIGDRVLFPHWEGQPMSDYFDEKYYRIIPDTCVFGTLDYEGDVKIVEQMKKLMEKFSSVTESGAKTGPGVPNWEPPAASSWFTS